MVARKIAVVQLLPELKSGGVEKGTLEIGRFLAESGHRSMVVSGGGRLVERLEAEGSKHIHLNVGQKNPLFLPATVKLAGFLKKERIDIAHARSRLPAWSLFLACHALPAGRRPVFITTFHGYYSVNSYSAIMAKGRRVIAVSHGIAAHIRRYYNLSPERVRVIYRGVDTDSLKPELVSGSRKRRLLKGWGIQDEKVFVILFPGRITRLKGHDILLRALDRIRDIPWVAVCPGEADSKAGYGREVLRMARELGLCGRIIFPGICSDMPAAFSVSDIVVNASRRPESFGRTIVEAQAMERPVIAPALGGCLETVLHSKTGWHFVPGDHESLKRAIMTAISARSSLGSMGRKGRSWVARRFSLRRMCDKTLGLYRKELAELGR